METKGANIPEHIFEWLEKYSFEDLTIEGQHEVLIYMDTKEYASFRYAIVGISEHRNKPVSQNKDRIKAELLSVFDKKYAPVSSIVVMNRPFAIWKAAAMFALVFGAGWMATKLVGEGKGSNEEMIAQIDTVFVEKLVPQEAQIIHDTVYIKSSNNRGNQKGASQGSVATTEKSVYTESYADGIPVVSVSEFKNRSNQTKGNSMKDDSLWRKLTVVSL